MTRAAARNWHVTEESGAITLSRRLPARFDLSASTDLPAVAPLRLAQQIRQDIWRALRGVRGFAPVVRVETQAGRARVTAGGSVAGRFARPQAEAALRAVLDDPANRARWIRFARAGNHA